MTAQAIPLDDTTEVTEYDCYVDLGDLTYRLDFRWNRSDNAWRLSLWSPLEEPILSGALLVPWVNYLLGCTHPQTPTGSLVLTQTKGRSALPDVQTLGHNYRLLYAQ